MTQSDRQLLETRQWRHEGIAVQGFGATAVRSVLIRGKRKMASKLFPLLPLTYFAERSLMPAHSEILWAAMNARADWYIAHTLAPLSIAVRAARASGAKVGFDCEDLLAFSGTDSVQVVRSIERKYLRACDYVSVPSEQMADELAGDYGITRPLVLPNVFPLILAKGMSAPSCRPGRKIMRLHWFSQTVGPGRGLEEAVHALSLLDGRAELHIRGALARDYEARLRAIATACSVHHQLFFLPLVPQDEVIRSMEAFDVGLALERPQNRNYNITITNKVFSYLLAGLAVAATDTTGQSQILRDAPDAGFTYRANDPAQLASGLKRWLDNPNALLQAKRAAWKVARQQLCWERFEERFLEVVSWPENPES